MKRYLAGAAVAACLLAIGTGTSAAASFDPSTQTGFISRGEIISAGGKGAVIADPVVSYTFSSHSRITCTFADSTRLQTSLTVTTFSLYRAETRFAGNGTITGYFISPHDLFDGDTTPHSPPDLTTLCWEARGVASDGTAVTTDIEALPSTSALTFFGGTGPLNLGF
jgi:hypothetical protein